MADPQTSTPGTKGPAFLQKKIGPVPVWAIGALTVGVVGYLWWRNRQSASAGDTASSDASGDGTTAGDSSAVPTTDYGQGWDYGYQAGVTATGDTTSPATATGDTGGTQPTTAHNRISAKVKNPAGQTETVYGYGTWVKSPTTGQWVWNALLPSNRNAFQAPYSQPKGARTGIGQHGSSSPNDNGAQPHLATVGVQQSGDGSMQAAAS